MQSQRGVVELQGSTSSNSLVDPQTYWNNMLNQLDHQEMGDFVLSPGDTVMPFTNGSNCESGSFDGWNFTNPGSSGTAANPINLEEAKADQEWTSSLLPNTNTISRLHEGLFEAGNVLSMENVDVNNNSNQIPSIQERDAHQNSGLNTEFVGSTGQLSETSMCHLLNSCGQETLRSEPVIAPISSRGACAGNRFIPEDIDGRLQDSLNCQRIAGKRKVIEVATGQASSSGNMKHFHKGESSKQDVSVENSLNVSQSISNSFSNVGTEVLFPSSDAGGRAATLGSHSSVTRAENTRRSVRRRISPSHDHSAFLPNLWTSGDSLTHPHIWTPSQPPSLPIPFIQLPEVGTGASIPVSQAQSCLPTIPSLPQDTHTFSWNGSSSSHTRTLPSPPTVSGGRLPSRRVARNIPLPVTDLRHLAQDPTNWNMSMGSMSSLGHTSSYSRIGSASYPSSPPLPPSQVPNGRYPLRLSDIAHRSFAVSDSGPQSNNAHLQDLSHPNGPQEIIRSLGTVSRSQQRQLLRSAFLLDRENEIFGVPLPLRIAALRDGRSRMISEQVRSALDVIRRRENVRFESVFFGGVDLHDRHRDMRLDVDNMSYEELLALEERIGNVSTGLTEETVVKHLKQHKYTSHASEVSEYAEPCCVCQEEYVKGEDLGSLDCGHIFHTECIKKWLSHKNLCPICKTTGLVT